MIQHRPRRKHSPLAANRWKSDGIRIAPHDFLSRDLKSLSEPQLTKLAAEIREARYAQIVERKPAHFASNLGVVELCLALCTS
ncbi:MAG: 1-deoxy-D-xylulose-5-phosphate synthase N-terminal domain-containing protein [Planctomycetaceae bacterium]